MRMCFAAGHPRQRNPTKTAAEAGPTTLKHPAVTRYAAKIGHGSRRTLVQSLEVLARLKVGLAPDAAKVPAVRWERLTSHDVATLRDAVAKHFAPATANKMLSLLRGVLRACHDLELMSEADCDAAVKVPNVEATWQPPTISLLTVGDVRRLFQACATKSSTAGRRDAVLLAIFLNTGLRRTEAAMLDTSDVHEGGRSIRIRSSKRIGEHREAPLGAAARKYLQDWLNARDETMDAGAGGHASPSMPLLLAVNKSGRIGADRRLTDQAIYNMIRGIGIEAGLPQVTSRALRLTYVVNLIAQGLAIERVQELVGHASWVTTKAYRELAERAAREGFKAFEIPYIPPARASLCGGPQRTRKPSGGKR